MRVLFITKDFPNPLEPTRGMFNGYTASALARAHDVTVVAPVAWRDAWRFGRSGRSIPATERRDGIEVHHPVFYYPPGVLRTTYEWCLWRSVRRTVGGLLTRFRPDVVLGFWVHPDGGAALRIAARAGVPGVVMAGGSDVLVLGRNPIRRRSIAKVLRRADAVICVSHHLKRAVEALGAPEGHVHVVDNGLNPAVFCPGDRAASRRALGLDPDAPTLLWVGRMVPVKAVDVLLAGFAAAAPERPDSTLCLIGDGPLRASLAARAARLGIAARVRFVGNVGHEQLADWFRAADVTLLPSLSEGSPNVLLESMACGTPFIASRVGGIPEIADAELDVLVPAGDAAALAEAIRDRLAHPRVPGRARVRCTWNQHADRMVDVFRRAAAAHDTVPNPTPIDHLAGVRPS